MEKNVQVRVIERVKERVLNYAQPDYSRTGPKFSRKGGGDIIKWIDE